MYTKTGVNHINRYLAGKAHSVASHIALGIDSMNLVGDAEPFISDRYPFAWESLRVPVVSTTVVDNTIIFTTSDNSVPIGEYIANQMALIWAGDIDANTQRRRKYVFNNFTQSGYTGSVVLDPTNTPKVWFNSETGMLLTPGMTATLDGTLGLSGYGSPDVLSIPVFWTTAAPTGGVLTVTFTFKVNGVDTTYSISDTVVSSDSLHYKFSSPVSSSHPQGSLLTTQLASPIPAVWSKKLGSGTLPSNFINNLSTIWRVQIGWTCPQASKIYVGAPQITPDFDADSSSVVVSHGDLSVVIVNSGTDNSSAEYRIPGFVKA